MRKHSLGDSRVPSTSSADPPATRDCRPTESCQGWCRCGSAHGEGRRAAHRRTARASRRAATPTTETRRRSEGRAGDARRDRHASVVVNADDLRRDAVRRRELLHSQAAGPSLHDFRVYDAEYIRAGGLQVPPRTPAIVGAIVRSTGDARTATAGNRRRCPLAERHLSRAVYGHASDPPPMDDEGRSRAH